MYRMLEADGCRQFKFFVRSVLEALSYLQRLRVVHTDLKSENIMISFNARKNEVLSVKLIDFGTSMPFEAVNDRLSITTPEYLPPEVLEAFEGPQKRALSDRLLPWSIDVWSFGIVLLELVIGFPMYLAYKGRVCKKSFSEKTNSYVAKHSSLQTGLLACSTRQAPKILKLLKQNFGKGVKKIL